MVIATISTIVILLILPWDLAAKDNNINVVGVAAGATVESVKIINQNGALYLS